MSCQPSVPQTRTDFMPTIRSSLSLWRVRSSVSLVKLISISSTSVNVFEPNDVVFAQIIAALHFDHHELDHARIFEAMFVTRRNIGRLVGRHEEVPLTVDDLGH